MATIIGFAGGLYMALWFWFFAACLHGRRARRVTYVDGFGWITKMIPFIDMFPTLTLSAWRIVFKPAQDRQRRASKMGDRAASSHGIRPATHA